MILMRANPLQGPLEGVGPEKNQEFLGPEMATGEGRDVCLISRLLWGYNGVKRAEFQRRE